MMNIEMSKTSNNRIEFIGDIEYTTSGYKKIEHEGEVYTKEVITSHKKTIAELKKENKHSFYDREYDFEELGYSIVVEDCNMFYNSLSSKIGNIIYSENDYVRAICYAFENGFLDERIKDVFTGKTDYYHKWDSIIHHLEVRFPLVNYGFNNTVYYSISIETLLSLPFENIPKDLVDLFKKNGVNIKSENINNTLIKLINKKVDYETSKQQKFNRFSI